MKKYDVLLTWPNSVDYPPFRKFLRDYSPLFANKIFINFNDTLIEPNFTEFLTNWFSLHSPVEVEFVGCHGEQKDWRDLSINSMLEKSTGEFVWFTEQDFFIKDPLPFFESVSPMVGLSSGVSFRQSTRLHPACLFVSRENIEKTSKNFSANPPESDHFGIFSKELEKIEPVTELKDIGLEAGIHWFHHNGLSHNYTLAERDQVPNYDIPNFLAYNAASRECVIEQDPRYVELTHKVERLLTDVKIFV